MALCVFLEEMRHMKNIFQAIINVFFVLLGLFFMYCIAVLE